MINDDDQDLPSLTPVIHNYYETKNTSPIPKCTYVVVMNYALSIEISDEHLPNRFNRFMQWLCFGFQWRKIK